MKLKEALLLVLSVIALTTGKFFAIPLEIREYNPMLNSFKGSPIGFVAPNCPHWTKCWHDYRTGRVKY